MIDRQSSCGATPSPANPFFGLGSMGKGRYQFLEGLFQAIEQQSSNHDCKTLASVGVSLCRDWNASDSQQQVGEVLQ